MSKMNFPSMSRACTEALNKRSSMHEWFLGFWWRSKFSRKCQQLDDPFLDLIFTHWKTTSHRSYDVVHEGTLLMNIFS